MLGGSVETELFSLWSDFEVIKSAAHRLKNRVDTVFIFLKGQFNRKALTQDVKQKLVACNI